MEEKRTARKGFRTVFLIALCGGILAEAILFLGRQLKEVNSFLQEDFRIIAIADRKLSKTGSPPSLDVSEAALEIIEEKLKSLPGVKDAHYVSGEERLESLKKYDPELAGSFVLLNSNPVPGSFEISVEESVFGDMASWTEKIRAVSGIEGLRYKPAQAYAILQVRFYERFLRFSLIASAMLLVLLGIMSVVYGFRARRPGLIAGYLTAGAAGAFFSVFFCFAVVYPVKYLSPLWVWPHWTWHAGIVFLGVFTGWILYQWKNAHEY